MVKSSSEHYVRSQLSLLPPLAELGSPHGQFEAWWSSGARAAERANDVSKPGFGRIGEGLKGSFEVFRPSWTGREVAELRFE